MTRDIRIRKILNQRINRRNRPNMDLQPAKAFKWSSVLFMHVQRGVIPNFTIFSGEELLQKIGIIQASESQKTPKSFEGVDGYL